ncbi:MAG: hypothetical protein H7061_00030 [Bdellovibrionaceae bacterium]|nr:hypothetical protein [Bdellovibrio sp.]
MASPDPKNNSFKFILMGLTVTSFLFAFRDIADLDIWWHLAAGRWMIQNTSFISKDIFSYTFFDSAWVSITWGYEVLMYFLYSAFHQSLVPLVTLHALLAALSVGFSFLAYRQLNHEATNKNLYEAGIFYLLLLWILELRWNHRAEMLSYFYIAAFLFILARAWRLSLENRTDKWIYACILIQLVWVNTHGLFPFGPIMIGSYLVSDFFYRKNFRSPFLYVFILSLLVSLLNPYGVTGTLWPLHLYSVLKDPFYHQTIEETRNALTEPVWLRDAWVLIIWLCLLIFQILTIGFRADWKSLIKKYSMGYFFSALILSWLAISARRNISILVIWTAPFVLDYLLLVFSPLNQFAKTSALKRWGWPVAFYVIMGLTCIGIVTNLVSDDRSATRFGASKRASRFPDRAIEFLKNHPTQSKIFSDTQFANYAIFTLPQFKSYIDSRYAEVYNVAHLKTYLDLLNSPQHFEQEMNRYDIKIVALTFDLSSQPLINKLISQKKWRLVFYDEVSALFAREDYAQTWLGPLANENITIHFDRAIAQIQTQVAKTRWLDEVSLKYVANDKVWPYVQLIEASLLVGHIEGAKQVDYTARQLAPNNSAVKNTHCETLFFDYAAQLRAKELSKFQLSQLGQLGVEACEAALLENPKMINFIEYIAFFKLNDGQVEGAIETFKKILTLTRRRDILIKVAELEIYQKRFLSAYDHYTEAQSLQLDPALANQMQALKIKAGLQ